MLSSSIAPLEVSLRTGATINAGSVPGKVAAKGSGTSSAAAIAQAARLAAPGLFPNTTIRSMLPGRERFRSLRSASAHGARLCRDGGRGLRDLPVDPRAGRGPRVLAAVREPACARHAGRRARVRTRAPEPGPDHARDPRRGRALPALPAPAAGDGGDRGRAPA